MESLCDDLCDRADGLESPACILFRDELKSMNELVKAEYLA